MVQTTYARVIIVVSGFFATYPINYIKKLIDIATGTYDNKADMVIMTGLIYLLFQFLGIFSMAFFKYFNKILELNIGHDIRQKLYSHLVTLPMSFYEKKSISELMVGLVEDSQITVSGFF